MADYTRLAQEYSTLADLLKTASEANSQYDTAIEDVLRNCIAQADEIRRATPELMQTAEIEAESKTLYEGLTWFRTHPLAEDYGWCDSVEHRVEALNREFARRGEVPF